ncbi:MAG: hypothetical protein ACMXX7_00535 [Candidatus Woesearchaeota archaeon]
MVHGEKMGKLKKLLLNPRIIILLLVIVISVVLINPSFSSNEVAIRSIVDNSAAAEATPVPMQSPDPNAKPRSREIIRNVNGFDITSVEQFYEVLAGVDLNSSVIIETNIETYFLQTRPLIHNETGEVIGVEDLGINAYSAPTNNIRKGLDLEGGTRVLIEPVGEITQEEITLLIDNIEQRLNVFGVSDVTVRSARDLFGNNYINVEIGGVNEEEVRDLLSRQGVFEAKIGNETVFRGGDQDILNVCRTADCARITPGSCREIAPDSFVCGFEFSITLSRQAAQRQADVTSDLEIINQGLNNRYLSEQLVLILDGVVVNELNIGADLRGNAVTNILISGSGEGNTRQAAVDDAVANMRQMQTVLITGSLPVELNIVKTDNISPAVGSGFIRNALFAGFLAILVVITFVSFRYKEPKIAIPMALTMLSELIILLGVASFINWRIDMAAIAAIIIAIGSGVDHQIVIAEETISNRKVNKSMSWNKKLAKAFFIIMAAYFTLVVAMLPLWFAGAGILRGFALTTIIGVTIGVLITRPAYAKLLEILVDEEDR